MASAPPDSWSKLTAGPGTAPPSGSSGPYPARSVLRFTRDDLSSGRTRLSRQFGRFTGGASPDPPRHREILESGGRYQVKRFQDLRRTVPRGRAGAGPPAGVGAEAG